MSRVQEIQIDRRACHPKDFMQRRFLDREQNMCKQSQMFVNYFTDFWNWFDLISIGLLAAGFFTHIADIIDHSDELARAHVRIMCITVIFIALRMLKVGRIINEEFGSLVMTIYFVKRDIIIWLIGYTTFLIPFSKCTHNVFFLISFFLFVFWIL